MGLYEIIKRKQEKKSSMSITFLVFPRLNITENIQPKDTRHNIKKYKCNNGLSDQQLKWLTITTDSRGTYNMLNQTPNR